MRALILYFSGTGNTAFISDYIYNHLIDASLACEFDIRSIEAISPSQITTYDFLCLGFPIYALRAPSLLTQFLEKIPDGNKIGLFFYCTMGFAAGNAFRRIWKKLRPKGFHHLASAKIQMPGSDGLCMMDPLSSYVKKAENTNYDDIPKLNILIDAIKREITQFEHNHPLPFVEKKLKINYLDSILGWMFSLFYLLIEKIMKKQYHVDDSCTRCGLCVQLCPTDNIRMDETGINFDQQCIVCLRCVHQCPAHAIQIGSLTKDKYRWHGPTGDFKPSTS